MTNRNKLILGVTAVGAIGVIFLLTRKQKVKKEKMLNDIADEGYETAGDILYPLKSKKYKGFHIVQ